MEQIIKTLRVAGMTCGSCARHVEAAIGGLSGVENVNVDLERGLVTVTLWGGNDTRGGVSLQQTTSASEIEAAVRRNGYEVVGEVEQPKERPRAKGCGCGCG